jgi:hypothetical protein
MSPERAYARTVPEDHVLVERDEVSVMFKRVADEPEAISSGMAEVEGAVGLRGRKYYGAFDADEREYRVCVELRAGDDPEALGLEVGTLPGRSLCPFAAEGRTPGGVRADRPRVQQARRTI